MKLRRSFCASIDKSFANHFDVLIFVYANLFAALADAYTMIIS
jgi:hypothetical protein